MNVLTVLLFSIFSLSAKPVPPDSISIQYCYLQAKQNYPTVKNIELQKRITDLDVKIANSGYFPQLKVNARGSYQSEVSTVNLPGGGGPPPLSKYQYEAALNIDQTIFDDGKIGIQKDLQRAKGKQNIASTRVKFHTIRSQIDQVYYGILLSQQQARTLNLKINDLQKQLLTVRSRVKNGVLLPGQQYILQAELIQSQNDSSSIHSNIVAGYRVLSKIIGKRITPTTDLILPQIRIDYRSLASKRPEYEQFKQTQNVLKQQRQLSRTQLLPTLSAFGTAAYGRPGLDFLNNDFHDYYIVGLRLKWNFWGAVNGGRQAQALQIQQKEITQNRKSFTRQLKAQLDQISQNIASIRRNLERDKKLVHLREKIVKQNASQLKNGVITSTEYVTALRRANQAKLALFLSKVQLSQAQINYITTKGIPMQPQATKSIYEH